MSYKCLAFIVVCAVMIAPLSADEAQPGKQKRKQDRQRGMATQLIKRLEAAKLTEDQIAKTKELGKQADAKAKQIREQAGITRKMLKQRAAAHKSLKDSGKQGKELMAAINEQAGLSKAQAEALKSIGKLRRQLQDDVVAMLSDEQKEQLPKQLKKRGKGRKRAGKSAA